MNCLSESDLGRICDGGRHILQTVGVRVDHEGVLNILAERGAAVDRAEGRVRMSPELVDWAIRTAPSTVYLSDTAGSLTPLGPD